LPNGNEYIFYYNAYTKNIKAYFNNDENTEKILNEESSYFIINQNYKNICFEKIKKGNGDCALSFFLINSSDQKNNFTIIRGITTRYYLPKGNIGYYSPSIYPEKSTKAVINFHKIKGNPVFYEYKKTNKNLLTDDEKIPDINGYISLSHSMHISKNCANLHNIQLFKMLSSTLLNLISKSILLVFGNGILMGE